MKVALAQINPTVGAIDANMNKILSRAREAASAGCTLCVFSEMAITGYPPHDLLERPEFISRTVDALHTLANATAEFRGMGIVIGCCLPSEEKRGKPLQNCAVLLSDGGICHRQAKSLLPTYDVFDERRYFEPAQSVSVVNWRNMVLGLTVCEDIWQTSTGALYDRDPVRDLSEQGAEIIINVSASPFTLDKRLFRRQLLKDLAKRHRVPVIFVNQVGGNDDLVFDGHSAAVSAEGVMIREAAGFNEDMIVVDLDQSMQAESPLEFVPEGAAFDALVLGTRDYAQKCGFSRAVLGLSGGIDSALVAAVAAHALGPANVYCVAMPTRYSSAGSLTDAQALAKNLSVHYQVIPIDDMFSSFLNLLAPVFSGTGTGVTEENLQARIRGVTLMALSNKFGYLLLTTGNKSEMATGYCTLYGDMAGGLAVLSDVPKTLVFRICEHLNRNGEVIPRAIIDKPPSAELRENQKDEDSLPPYSILDAILQLHIDEGQDLRAIVAAGFDEKIVRDIIRLVKNNEYKRRQAPPGLKITSKAFGTGRRMPMAQHWNG